MILLAHAGHWLVNIAYFAPVIGFVGWLGWVEVRGRREKRAKGPERTGPPAASGP